MSEPVLRADDQRLWDSWMRTALLHSRTAAHLRAVDGAKRIADAALSAAPTWACMWSGGKDSTAMTHLLRVEMGAQMPVITEKDDLDYPGELDYVRRLAAAWSIDLRVLVPEVSPAGWMAENCRDMDGDADMHSRAAGLSKACFYGLIEEATASFGGVFLGLRQEESYGRMMDRATHYANVDGNRIVGLYQYRSGRHMGRWKASPLGGWSGIDVYAYLASRGIEVFDVYKCIAFMHAREPWRVRKSWWVPGAAARHGGVAWLRHYYPSLFRQLCEWMPMANRYK